MTSNIPEARPDAEPPVGPRVWPVALIAGLIAGALDIAAAILLNPQVTAQVVLQSVAGGWLGREAYAGGWPTAWLGLASHFGVMLVIAAVWAGLAARVEAARRLWPVAGALWGAAVYAVMTWVVVPLSNATLPPPDATAIIQGLVVHVVCVGLPMAFITRRAFDR